MNQPTAISRTKLVLKAMFPGLAVRYSKLRTLLLRRQLRSMSLESVFRRHFQRRSWGYGETLSGPGSTLLATKTLRAALSGLLEAHEIKSLLDIPCGDGNWISQADLDLRLDLYIGADIVQELVEKNAERWKGKQNCRFLKLDLTCNVLPRVDLVLCRDGLVHLADGLVAQALSNIKRSGSRYLLATTFPDQQNNTDIVTGEWRPMNLQQSPFILPPPLEFILERKVPGYGDKGLGLWRIEDLPHL